MDAKAKPTDFLFFNYFLSVHMSHLAEEKHKPKGLKKKKRREIYNPFDNSLASFCMVLSFSDCGVCACELIVFVKDKGRFANWVESG